MPSIIKTFAKEAKNRRPTKKYEPTHASFLSSNWNQVKPKISRKKDEETNTTENIIAIDCEFVGVGPDGSENAVARVSVVDFEMNVLMDEFVLPEKRVEDFRTKITGITAKHMHQAKWKEPEARQKVAELLEGKIVVGHALQNDFKTLQLTHPHHMIRDTSVYRAFRGENKRKTPSLKDLASRFLQTSIQSGVHDSVEDARIALKLYKTRRDVWEKKISAAKPSEEDGDDEPEEVGEKIDRDTILAESSTSVKRPAEEQKPASEKKKAKKAKKQATEAVAKVESKPEPAEGKKKKKEQKKKEEAADAKTSSPSEPIEDAGGLEGEEFEEDGPVTTFAELLGDEKDDIMDLMKELEAARGFCFKEEPKKKKRAAKK